MVGISDQSPFTLTGGDCMNASVVACIVRVNVENRKRKRYCFPECFLYSFNPLNFQIHSHQSLSVALAVYVSEMFSLAGFTIVSSGIRLLSVGIHQHDQAFSHSSSTEEGHFWRNHYHVQTDLSSHCLATYFVRPAVGLSCDSMHRCTCNAFFR